MACRSETGGPVTRAHAGIPENFRECREAVPPKIFIVEDELIFAEDCGKPLKDTGIVSAGVSPQERKHLSQSRKKHRILFSLTSFLPVK